MRLRMQFVVIATGAGRDAALVGFCATRIAPRMSR